MNKICVITSVLILNTLAPSAFAQSDDFKTEMQTYENMVREYYAAPYGLSSAEELELQSAQALMKDYHSRRAYEKLKPLAEKYPEHYLVHRLSAEALLDMGYPEQALKLLENFLETRRAGQLIADEQFELQELHARAYLMQDEPEMALRIIDQKMPAYARLSSPYREASFLLRAEAYLASAQPVKAHRALQEGLAAGMQFQESRLRLQTLSEALAEKLYENALDSYDDRNYAEAVQQLLSAYQLNPDPVKYSQYISRSQDRFMDLYNQRFDSSRALLVNAVGNMRHAMRYRDYNTLYREYLRLIADRDVSFLLSYREYLPINMQTAFAAIEETLERQGLNVK